MKQLLFFSWSTAALTTFAFSTAPSAQAAQFFNFSYAYSGVTANGTLQTNDGNNDGSFTIEGILGQRNGVKITSLIAPGFNPSQNLTDASILGGNTIDRSDNLLFPTSALPVSFNGFSYRVESGTIQEFNVFSSNNFAGTIREFNQPQGSQPSDGGFALQVTAVPTPALLPGLIGIGIAAIRKKKRAVAQQE